MLRMEIEFNNEKVTKENVISCTELYKKIDDVVEELSLKKAGQGIYTDSGRTEDLSKFYAIMNWLEQAMWFRRYVVRWDWYNNRKNTIYDVEPIDLLENFYEKQKQ